MGRTMVSLEKEGGDIVCINRTWLISIHSTQPDQCVIQLSNGEFIKIARSLKQVLHILEESEEQQE